MGLFGKKNVKQFALGALGTTPIITVNYDKSQLIVIESLTKNTSFDLDVVTGLRAEMKGIFKKMELHVYVEGQADHVIQASSINDKKLGELNALLKQRQEARKQASVDASQPPEEKTTNVLDELERLADLRERGVLTEEEFAAMKKQLLG